MLYHWNPDQGNQTRWLYCSRCQSNTKQQSLKRARYGETEKYTCTECGSPAFMRECWQCENYTGSLMQPATKHSSGVFQCGIYGHPYDRDTPCAGCGLWTHRLTPGGLGTLYCTKQCESRHRGKSGFGFYRNPFFKNPTVNTETLEKMKTETLEKMKTLAHHIHGLNINIDQQWRIADDSKLESVREEAREQAHEYLAELQVLANDLADMVLELS